MDRESGFTLIELLVVIAIIGLLAAFLLAQFIPARQKARDAKRKDQLNALALALEQYHDANNAYPPLLGDLAPAFIAVVPIDPQTAAAYGYTREDSPGTGSGDDGYALDTELENTDDPALATKTPSGNPYRICGGIRIAIDCVK